MGFRLGREENGDAEEFRLKVGALDFLTRLEWAAVVLKDILDHGGYIKRDRIAEIAGTMEGLKRQQSNVDFEEERRERKS